jgi:hypothetical protein
LLLCAGAPLRRRDVLEVMMSVGYDAGTWRYDWTRRYPWIVEAALKNRQKRFVLDGEAVIHPGLPSVPDHPGGLQLEMHSTQTRHAMKLTRIKNTSGFDASCVGPLTCRPISAIYPRLKGWGGNLLASEPAPKGGRNSRLLLSAESSGSGVPAGTRFVQRVNASALSAALDCTQSDWSWSRAAVSSCAHFSCTSFDPPMRRPRCRH